MSYRPAAVSVLAFTFASAVAMLLPASPAPADEAAEQPGAAQQRERESNVTLPQTPSISPDGESVVFSYRGALWKVEADGGRAFRLTNHPATDGNSRFSPDGTRIAFTSDRRGSNGLYVMNSDGTGIEEVLVIDRAALISDYANGPDGEMLLFTGFIEPEPMRSPRPYSISASGGVHKRLHDAFGRNPVLEPDGERLLFVRGDASWNRRHYRGPDTRDVWLYDPGAPEDGRFTQLTTWDGNDGDPRWAGRNRFVFMSDREDDTVNLYLADLSNENPEENARRLTHFDDRDIDSFDVTPDGSRLVFARWDSLYTLDLLDPGAGPLPLSVLVAEDSDDNVSYVTVDNRVNEAALSPDGKTMAFIAYGQLYVRGTEANSASRRISDSLAKHKDIAWSPDGGTLYFVSDATGRDAIYAATATRTRGQIVERVQELHDRGELNGEENGENDNEPARPEFPPHAPDPEKWPDAIAFHVELVSSSDEGDFKPVPAHDGRHLAFTRGIGSLWVLDLRDGEEREIFNGWSRRLDYIWTYDHKHLVFVTDDADFNADIWITRTDGEGYRGEGRPVNISRHPQGDINMSISHDGRVLTFASQRGGNYDIYRVYLDEELDALAAPELQEYYRALNRAVRDWRVPGVPRWARERGSVSPLVEPPARDEEPQEEPADEAEGDAGDGEAAEGAAQAAEEADPDPQQLLGGLRRALRNFLLADDPAPDADPRPGAPRPDRERRPARPAPTLDDFPLENAYLRLQRIATGASNALLLPDASAVYYSTSAGVHRRAWDGSPQRVGDNVALRGMTPKGDKIFYVSGGRGGFFDTSGSRAHQQRNFNPSDRLEIDLEEMNERKFVDMARTLGDLFYHPTMKDLDWDGLTEEYAALARSARTSEEFRHVAMKLLGELNASHLGVTPPRDGGRPARQTYAYLGVRVELGEDGFDVKEVMETGPAGRGPMRIIPGDVITHLELSPIQRDRPLEVQLPDRVGRETVVTVNRNGRDLDLLITPVSNGAIRSLAYDNWRLENHRKVEEMSDGRLGYIHIEGMNQPSLDLFVRDLYAAAEGKEAIIIDVRNNGGGWTTDRLLASIMYPRHAYTVPRGMQDSWEAHRTTFETGGYPNDRLFIPRYDMPINMLCNEKSFSNAEIISHAFKTLGRGTLVGEETAGGVISTGSFSLVDGTTVRLPFRGWYLPDGTDMENNGAMPDIHVPQTPYAESNGDDEQLEAAVRDLLERLPAREEAPAAAAN